MAVLPQYQFQVGTQNQFLSPSQQDRLSTPYWTGQSAAPAAPAQTPQLSSPGRRPTPRIIPPPINGGGGMPSGSLGQAQPARPQASQGSIGMGAPPNLYQPPQQAPAWAPSYIPTQPGRYNPPPQQPGAVTPRYEGPRPGVGQQQQVFQMPPGMGSHDRLGGRMTQPQGIGQFPLYDISRLHNFGRPGF